MPQIGDNAVAVPIAHENVAGKIQKISLHNFMCYESKEINLNDKVNLFVGPIGSGKSVLTDALAVGLGANLNRFGVAADAEGTFLEGLVKKGQKEATIEITLSNVGSNAYQPDIYGQTITVCRTIGSTTGYQIKNSSGEAVATETHEEYHLGGILNQLKIQVDNPICILNQHLAQTLLIASNNTMMYELYLKGTQLDVLFQRLDDSIDSGEAMESCVTVLAENLVRIREEMKEILLSVMEAGPELQEDPILQLANLKEEYDIFYEEIDHLKDEILNEDSHSNIRKAQLETLISEIEQRLRYTFREILRSKNYEGSIDIDYEHKTLELKVTPAKGSKENLNDEETLSGNTLAIVAFILALWDCTKLPFYFLDEFDVFMDTPQRRIIMEMLLEYMKQHPTKQFGFLTPLDVAHIESNDTVSIHKLAAQ